MEIRTDRDYHEHGSREIENARKRFKNSEVERKLLESIKRISDFTNTLPTFNSSDGTTNITNNNPGLMRCHYYSKGYCDGKNCTLSQLKKCDGEI